MLRLLLAAAPLLGVLQGLSGCSGEPLTARHDPAPPQFEAGRPGETGALRAPIWDDGNAEIASYRTTERRYGEMREGEAVLITVKEAFDADALVKADGPVPPRHSVTVMKLNTVVTVPAGVYTYRQMASTYLTREDARPVKLAVGSQEWCGLTSKVLKVRGGMASLVTHSYFGGEADRAFTVPLGDDAVLADSLPLWLRTLELERPGERSLRVVDEQLSNRGHPPRVQGAVLAVGPIRTVEVPAGSYRSVPVQLLRGERRDTFWLAAKPPHPLVRWDRADGGVYELEWLRRAPYWLMNGPEDVGALDPEPNDDPEPSDANETAPPPARESL